VGSKAEAKHCSFVSKTPTSRFPQLERAGKSFLFTVVIEIYDLIKTA
jgi:hypothetical protein